MRQTYFRNLQGPKPRVLIGVRRICEYLTIGHKTLKKWYTHHELPLSIDPTGGRWMTTTSLIDEWIKELGRAQREEARTEQEAKTA